jgi:RND family efflux transporter MFP subunit
MKKLVYSLTIAILLVACGNSGETSIEQAIESKDLEVIRSKRSTITEELKVLESQITQLDEAILELDDNAKLPLVSVLNINSQEFQHYLELQGDVMTNQNILVYPQMPGTLYKIYVKEGQRVAKGQLLGAIDDGGLSSQLALQKTQLDLAKTTFERQERLWKQKIGSEIQYLQAKAQYDAQVSGVKQLESQVGRSLLRAPFSGIVDQVIKDQGTVVSPGPGAEVFRVVNLKNMYIEIEVPEAHLATVTKGKEVEVHFPILGSTLRSKVDQTSNFINPGNRSFRVEIPISNENGNIKPNLTAVAKINDYTNENAILIPQSVLSENAIGEQYVYVTKENDAKNETIAQKVIITLGKSQGDNVEVLSGLKTGDNIIVEGARSVRDNQQVKVIDAVKTAEN